MRTLRQQPVAKQQPLVLVLLDFDEGEPGIVTISAINRPTLEGSLKEKANLVKNWIKDKNTIAVR